MTRPIYLNNAATSWPKPERVVHKLVWAMTELAASPGRAGSAALECDRVIFSVRERVAAFIGCADSSHIAFTPNATWALNQAILGLLQPGDRAVTTSMDHNSVSRPLAKAVEERGVEVVRVPCAPTGELDPSALLSAARGARLVVLTHASNVSWAVQPVGEIARGLGALGSGRPLLLVDAAQTAGVFPLEVEKTGIDLLAASGHKSLYGPQGTGFLWARPGLDLAPLAEGGTGGHSDLVRQPGDYPERLECGTPNTPGIAALGEALAWLVEEGPEEIRAHEARLMEILLDGLSVLPGVDLYGPRDPARTTAVLSFRVEGMDPAETATLLEELRGVQVRVGLHCSPWGHRTLGTFPEGTVRASPGAFNTEEDVLELAAGVRDILRMRGRT